MTLAQVKEFNETFGVAMSSTPTTRVPAAGLRYELIREELEELHKAIEELDIIEIADALGDIQYVVDGATLVFGLEGEVPTGSSYLENYGIRGSSDVEIILFSLHSAILFNNLTSVVRVLDKINSEVRLMAESFGIDLDAVVYAIHKSNMSKLGEDGKPVYREGDRKVLKGPNYKTPTDDIRRIVFGENYAPAGE